MRTIFAFGAGILFSAGLMVSGMINPAKVLGFLNIVGDWDPSLAFVMAGAVAVNLVCFRLTRYRSRPLLADRFWIPEQGDIDAPLVRGAVLFGIGWGLVGLCPGPAIAALGAVPLNAIPFVAAMLVGMVVARRLKHT